MPLAALGEPAKAPTEPRALLAAASKRLLAMKGYQITIQVTDVARSGKTAHDHVMVRYASPNHYRFDVLQSTRTLASGSKSVFRYGESMVRSRAGGVLGFASLTLPLHDKNVVTLNAWPPDRILMQPVLTRALAGGYQISDAGKATVGGVPASLVRLQHPHNPLDPDIAYEQVAIDRDHLVRSWTCYADHSQHRPGDLIYQFVVEQMTIDPTFAEGTFSL